MKDINKFYCLHLDKTRQIHEFELPELEKTTYRGGSTAFYDSNGRISGGESTFTNTTEKDYDKLFLKKVLKIEPVYRVSDLLDYHFNFYLQNHKDYDLFITHIQYVILPKIEIQKHYKPFKEIIINWLEKNKKMNKTTKPTRKGPTPAMKKRLQAEINSKCPFCDSTDVEIFEFHHIDGDRSNTFDKNLLMVCPTCHAKIEQGLISLTQVKDIKSSLPLKPNKDDSDKIKITDSKLYNPVIGNNNTVNITVKKQVTKKSIEKYPEGSIGRDVIMYGYSKYLADRYAEFRNFDLKQKNEIFDYRSFSGKVKKDFKSGGFFQTPQTRFFELVEYLQAKINRTILAKVNKSKGISKNYDTFEEYKLLNTSNK